MKQVSKEEFWAAVMGCSYNIHPSLEGKWPYTSVFKRQDGSRREFGRVVAILEPGKYPPVETYFLADDR